jgi:hypothetical protein
MLFTPYAGLLAAHTGCILTIFLAVFLPGRKLKALAAIAGAVTIWLPLGIQLQALGHPNPSPPQGDYQLLTSQPSASEESLYIYVQALEQDDTPRLYRIPFPKITYERLETAGNADNEIRVIRVEPGESSEFEVFYISYEPPDLIKGEPRRGTRYQ